MSTAGIKIFATGGTFDKEYNEITGTLFFQNTHLTDMLQRGRCLVAVSVETLMMGDRLEQTARGLGKNSTGKTIVLPGAMVPYTFGSSDGMFNLGAALALVQTLPPGVYVAMNGRCFPWNLVRKNRRLGVFEAAE